MSYLLSTIIVTASTEPFIFSRGCRRINFNHHTAEAVSPRMNSTWYLTEIDFAEEPPANWDPSVRTNSLYVLTVAPCASCLARWNDSLLGSQFNLSRNNVETKFFSKNFYKSKFLKFEIFNNLSTYNDLIFLIQLYIILRNLEDFKIY